MICVPITASNTEEAINDIKQASEKADVIELRLDFLDEIDLDKLFSVKTKPYIITIRSKDAGGNFTGTDEEKTNLLLKSIDLGAEYVDIELNYPHLNKIIRDKKTTKIIVSHHDFSVTPKNLEEIYRLIKSTGCDIAKVVTNALSINDNIKIFEILKKADTPLIAFCIGEKGLTSRILCLAHGSLLTFASLKEGNESAPGQATIDEMLSIYNTKKTTKQTQVLGVIGRPAKHSLGKTVHNAIFKKRDIDAVYIPFEVDSPKPMMELINYLNIRGCSITMPHKQSFLPYLTKLDSLAKKIGAINCIVNNNSEIVGYNTDYRGVHDALSNKTNLVKKSVVIIGAGGAARAALAALTKYTKNVTIVNRTEGKAKELAKHFGVNSAPISELNNLNCDILINATSVGMTPNINESPVADNYFDDKKPLVFDVAYTPELTKFLKQARQAGCEIVSGVEMFIYQAIEQLKHWLGIKVTYNEIKELL